MELGNMIFGNSRGNFEFPDRNLVNCREWQALTDAVCDGYHCYAKDGLPENESGGFENDVFAINPYYWGDCACGFEERDAEWVETHKHKPNCYQNWVRYEKRKRGIRDNMPFVQRMEAEKPIYQEACAKFGFDYERGGFVGHCTCRYNEEYDAWREANDHDPKCPIVRHNFVYKPTGFCIDWYKYPFRDSYMSDDVTERELKEMWRACLKSVKEADKRV